MLVGTLGLQRQRSAVALYGATFLLSLAVEAAFAAARTAIVESVPRLAGAGTLGLMYAGTVAVFGGSTQFMIAWLTKLTGNGIVPALVSARSPRARTRGDREHARDRAQLAAS